MDAIEKWGVSVEEAVELALKEMKLSRDDVEVTILEEPSRGFFGIGSKLAKVRVEAKKPAQPELPEEPEEPQEPVIGLAGFDATPEPEEEEDEDRPSRSREERSRSDRPRRESRDRRNRNNNKREKRESVNIALDGMDKDSMAITEDHEALTFLKEITGKMDLNLDFVCRTGENMVYIEMSGPDSRTVIGKRGQTLDAVQYLTSLVVNKDNKDYIKVVIDAENYRAKRQRTLEQLADRLAGKVSRTRKSVRLEPMNPYERKVIHATLQSHPSVTTRSEGEEPYRRVIIELKK